MPSRKYTNFVLTVESASSTLDAVTANDITTYSFNAFVTDRLTDDKTNILEVQSLSKTILEQILAECFDALDTVTYTFWTEKFNDLCAGCYANFSISLPKELICADDEWFEKDDEEGTPYAIIFTTANPPSSNKVAVIKALRIMTINELAPTGWPLKLAKDFYEQATYSSLDFGTHDGYTSEFFNRELSKEAIEEFMKVAKEYGVAEFIQILYK